MKLILDFEGINQCKVTTDDDKDNYYLLVWIVETKKYSLWYNNEFVWDKEYENSETAIANLVANLLSAMKNTLVK